MSDSRRSRALPAIAVALALAGALLATPPSQAAQADDTDRLTGATSARAVVANRALSRASGALSGNGDDATIALRDLYMVRDSLSPSDRAAAEKMYDRPVKTNVVSGGNISVHYNPLELTGSFDQDDVLNISLHVSQMYSGSGYRLPKPDFGKGGSNKTDIYVDKLDPGLYGYCTIDNDTQSPGPGRYDVPAFCVVDNDYAGFPSNTPLENLQVTVAHEYMHATQFAYDFFEDPWLLESTAAWAEDEVYDSINDNTQYLPTGAIGQPKKPMVKFSFSSYGQWIFFRYLSEKFPKKKGSMPKVVLDIWKAADSSKGSKKNRHSTEAIKKVLAKQKFSIDKAFSFFSDANRRSRQVYDEGAANAYPVKKLAGKKKLKRRGQSKKFTAKLNPFTSATYRYYPRNGLGKKFKLKVSISGPAKSKGTRAVVTLWKSNGKAKQKFVKISGKGKGATKVAFGGSKVQAVEVTLVNASTRTKRCFYSQSSPWPCYGKPVDKNSKISVRGLVTKG